MNTFNKWIAVSTLIDPNGQNSEIDPEGLEDLVNYVKYYQGDLSSQADGRIPVAFQAE